MDLHQEIDSQTLHPDLAIPDIPLNMAKAILAQRNRVHRKYMELQMIHSQQRAQQEEYIRVLQDSHNSQLSVEQRIVASNRLIQLNQEIIDHLAATFVIKN